MKKNTYFIIAILFLVCAGLSFYLIKKVNKLPMPEYAEYHQPARSIEEFTLTDQDNNPFNNKRFINKWTFVFFGYISCPDVCPTTMLNLNFMYDDLTEISNKSQVILVSVDPNRDTVEKLKQYITYFNPNFKALRAEHDVLFPFARNLGLMYEITDKENQGVTGNDSYWVDHSGSLVLINPNGKIEATFNPEQNDGEIPAINNELLISDYRKIVALYK